MSSDPELLPPIPIQGQKWHTCVRCNRRFLSNITGVQHFCMNCRPIPPRIKRIATKNGSEEWV